MGLLLLGGVFVAVGIFASALTSSQIIAFIVSMFLCWFLFDGLHMLGDFGQFGALDYLIKYLSLAFHYDSIKKGVIVTEDLIFFISVIALFLYAAHTALKTLKR
jgi:ABC-2 type transport system permease protein